MTPAPLRRGFPLGASFLCSTHESRFFVPTSDQQGVARSRRQDWPQATAGGGA